MSEEFLITVSLNLKYQNKFHHATTATSEYTKIHQDTF